MAKRVLWTAFVWLYCSWAWVLVVAETELGPTVYQLTYTHGIHLGDLVASVVLPAYALWLTWAFWRRPGPRR